MFVMIFVVKHMVNVLDFDRWVTFSKVIPIERSFSKRVLKIVWYNCYFQFECDIDIAIFRMFAMDSWLFSLNCSFGYSTWDHYKVLWNLWVFSLISYTCYSYFSLLFLLVLYTLAATWFIQDYMLVSFFWSCFSLVFYNLVVICFIQDFMFVSFLVLVPR